MATNLSDADIPHGVQIERFARVTIRCGFYGGQEKEVTYDERRMKDDELHFQQYLERDAGTIPKGAEDGDFELSEVVRRQTNLKALAAQDLTYEERVSDKTMYLMSWDHGRNIHIMEEEAADKVLSAIASQQDRMHAGNLPSSVSEIFESGSSSGSVYNAPPSEPESKKVKSESKDTGSSTNTSDGNNPAAEAPPSL